MSSQLDPTILSSIRADLLGTLPHPPDATPECISARNQAALAAFEQLRPRDMAEATLAVSAVAAHYAGMENFRLADQPDISDDLRLRFQAEAVKLLKRFYSALQAIEHHRSLTSPESLPVSATPAIPPADIKQPAQSATATSTAPARPALRPTRAAKKLQDIPASRTIH